MKLPGKTFQLSTKSPFFTLDESILFSSQAALQDHVLELGHPEEDIYVEGNVVFKDVPRGVHVPRSKVLLFK